MEVPFQLTSGFLPFPDTRISSNLAPVTEEDNTSPSANNADAERKSSCCAADRSAAIDDPLPLAKRRRMIFLCEPCGTFYTEKRALARHRHTDSHRRNIGAPLAVKYPCKLCGKQFSRDHDRQRHEKEKHNGIKRSSKSKIDARRMSFLSDETSRRDSVTTMGMMLDADEKETESPANVTTSDGEKLRHERKCDAPVEQAAPHRAYEESWFTEHTDDETEAPTDMTPRSQESLKTVMSNAADSAIDVDMPEEAEEHEAKYPAITTYDYRNDREDEKVCLLSEMTEGLSLDTAPRLVASVRPRATAIQRHGKIKTIPPIEPFLCAFCKKPFEDDHHDLLAHLRQHLDLFRGEVQCQSCKIGFVHKADLEKHKNSANVLGHCGFSFHHLQPCTGHHPPSRDQLNIEFTDRDTIQLCTQLRHWEQSQLKAYIEEVKGLIASRNARVSNCYSVEALIRRSRDSLSSFAFSINTFGSAPCDTASNGKTDVRGLQDRLRKMSLKDSTTLIRQRAKKFPHIVRSGTLNRGLYNAAKKGDLAQIEQLVKLGALPNAVVDNISVLSAAVQEEQKEAVRLLIELGVNLNASNSKVESALSIAAFEDRSEMAQLLINSGANVCLPGGRFGCALSAAAASGATEAMEVLVENGANLNQYGGAYGLPLSTAAASGKQQSVQTLLRHGADVNRYAGSEGCALGFAVWVGDHEMVSLLLRNGANVDGTGRGRHGSPLCSAIQRLATGRQGYIEIIRTLLENGADVNLQGQPDGNALRTAALHADIAEMSDVVKLLLKYGADVHVTGVRGSALQLAKRRRDFWLEKMPLLIQDKTDGTDEILGHCYEVIRLLREAGAGDGERKSSGSFLWYEREENGVHRKQDKVSRDETPPLRVA